MKVKFAIGMLTVVAMMFSTNSARAFIFNHDRSLLWNETSSTWDDANSWDNVQGADLGTPGGNNAYALIESGTATIAPGNVPAGQIFRSYIGGTGAGGGTLNVSADSSYGRFYTAWLPGEAGYLNLSAGTMSMNSGNFELGHEGDSVATISGGTLNASTIFLAAAPSSTSYLEISSGTLTGTRLQLDDGTATVNVNGSGSTITLGRFNVFDGKGHTLELGLDAGGITTINVFGDQAGGDSFEGATLNDLAIVVDDLVGFSGVVGDTYDIINSTSFISVNGITVTDTIAGLDFTWAIVTEGGSEILRLTAVPEPSSVLFFSIAGCFAITFRRVRS